MNKSQVYNVLDNKNWAKCSQYDTLLYIVYTPGPFDHFFKCPFSVIESIVGPQYRSKYICIGKWMQNKCMYYP